MSSEEKTEVVVGDNPMVTVTCEVCAQVAVLPAGTDVTKPEKALKESGFALPILGQCKGAPTKCLLELARLA